MPKMNPESRIPTTPAKVFHALETTIIHLIMLIIFVLFSLMKLQRKPFSAAAELSRKQKILYAKPFNVNAVYANICSTSFPLRFVGFKAS